MSDDIHEVMRPTPFSPLKRITRSGTHKDNTEERSGGWADDNADEKPPSQADDLETLAREVDSANVRLRVAGKSVRLRLAAGSDAPFIEILLPSEGGGEIVTRRIAPGEIAAWVQRLETAEGLVIDEKM
jgi:hypothetical protein